MVITEVRIKLMQGNLDRLQAFCSVTFDGAFVVHDVKIIQKEGGECFIAMPSRKLTDHCSKCGTKNHLRACFCNSCGYLLPKARATSDGHVKLHADIAHPINTEFRAHMEYAILEAFFAEKKRAQQDGYVCRYDDHDDIQPPHLQAMAKNYP